MKLFVTGSPERLEEMSQCLNEGHEVDLFPHDIDMEEIDFHQYNAVFDLNLDDEPERLIFYAGLQGVPVVGCAVKVQLAEMVYYSGIQLECMLMGINSLPTFLDRSLKEFSVYEEGFSPAIDKLCSELGWEYKIVKDRVGMVSPRVIMMIINEAFYTLQEGTASEKDIDESMKLGTNYPYGPFEWCERIGLEQVYETLESIYQDTHDERYKICPLLKTRYLRTMKTV